MYAAVTSAIAPVRFVTVLALTTPVVRLSSVLSAAAPRLASSIVTAEAPRPLSPADWRAVVAAAVEPETERTVAALITPEVRPSSEVRATAVDEASLIVTASSPRPLIAPTPAA